MSNYEIVATSVFVRSIKRLAKKYPCVKKVYKEALEKLEKMPGFGDEIGGHQDYYKERYANTDAGKGKSGGFRLIYCWPEKGSRVIMVDIYTKSDQENVDWSSVQRGIKELENGL